jgi:hypothetical protein
MTYGFNPSQGLIIVSVHLFGPAGDMIVRLALDTEATSTLFFFEPRRGTPGAMLRDPHNYSGPGIRRALEF